MLHNVFNEPCGYIYVGDQFEIYISDTLLTCEPHITDTLGCARQRADQLYCCCSLLIYQGYTNLGFIQYWNMVIFYV